MNFASDNWAGAHPKIAQSLVDSASGFAAPYGASELDQQLQQRFNELFEREVAVFFVATGTAANALALASVYRPGGVVFCHRESHLLEAEGGAPEFLSHGARFVAVDGQFAKIDPVQLKQAIARFPAEFVHAGQAMAISITQATEAGTLYQADEILAIAAIAKANNLPLHMDGARFANAAVALGLTPAEMTWKLGVDILSFGATKNGCWCAEAIVFMHPQLAKAFPYIRKQAAQLISKSRFIACQFEAYLRDALWLQLASHANAMASRLQAGIIDSAYARMAWPAGANEVFCIFDQQVAEQLRQQGAQFYAINPPSDLPNLVKEHEILVRLVTSYATTTEDIAQFLTLLATVGSSHSQ